MRKLIALLLVCFGLLFTQPAYAAETTTLQNVTHFTVIMNQVRGAECCSAGGVTELKNQLENLEKIQLPATFTIRYDAVKDYQFASVLQDFKKRLGTQLELGAFLEITPQLAADAGVPYDGNKENWYEAEHAFLVGYQPADRHKLIDTYMQHYQQVFGQLPQTTTAWMIDSDSLNYLSSKYHVLAHQLTREQWGTDSYTLDGGPAHYPYRPSANWPLIPDEKSNSPVILRQTVTDPVWNYGDPTSSFTSQPNDYGRRERGIAYFRYIFLQAHNSQPSEPYTFALLGLENSMPELDQQEFFRQLEIVREWDAEAPERQTVTAANFAKWFTQNGKLSQPEVQAYAGGGYEQPNQQAWTISSDQYRLRLRRDGTKLYLSDLRLYSPEFADPYAVQAVKRHGHWVVPFLLDGARFRLNATEDDILTSIPDNLSQRRSEDGQPTRIELPDVPDQKMELQRKNQDLQLVSNDKVIATFEAGAFWLPNQLTNFLGHPKLQAVLKGDGQNLAWQSRSGQIAWQVSATADGNQTKFVPKVSLTDLSQERAERYPYLFPELIERPIDTNQTELYVNNRYAVAGRNPVRLVLFPRDSYGYPVAIINKPQASSQPDVAVITQEQPHSSNGMIFIDFTNAEPGAFQATVSYKNFTDTEQIYFAPDCKNQPQTCLTQPRQAWWYLQSLVQDKIRSWQEKNQQNWMK